MPLRPSRDDLAWAVTCVTLSVLIGLLIGVTADHGLALLVPGLAVFSAFVYAAFRHPVVGLTGFGLALTVEAIHLPLPSGALSPSEGVLLLTAFAYLVRLLVRPETVVAPSLHDGALLVLIIAIFSGIAVSPVPVDIIRVTLFWVAGYGVFLQAQSLSAPQMRIVLGGFAVGVAFLGVIGTLAYLAGPSTLYGGGLYTSTRAAGSFSDPNYYASILALAIVPALALVLHRPRANWWIGLAAAAATAGVLFSLSRGGIIAVGGGMLVLTLWNRARAVMFTVVAIFAALTLANANPIFASSQYQTISERLGTLGNSSALESTNRRPQIWALAVELGIQHPVVGVGSLGFKDAATRNSVFERGGGIENTHNMFLSFLAENGVTGFLAFMVFLGQLSVRALRAVRSRDLLERAIALGIAASLVGFALQGLTQMQLRVNAIVGAFLLLGGMLTALARRQEERDRAVEAAVAAEPGPELSLRPGRAQPVVSRL